MTFRPDRHRRLARLAATTGLALLLTATGYAEAQGVLSIGRREDSTTFDPITTAQNVDYWVYGNIFETLIATDRTGTELAPGLAERWEMSDDGLTYTFHLRESRFSDCTPVTASDAAFTLLRVRDDPGSLWADYYATIADARAVDDRTLVVSLHEPWVPFLAMLAVPALAVLPQATFAADPEGFAERPVGSGAFRVAEWRRGDRLILARNDCYWNADAVSLEGVEWISIPDDNSRVLSLQTGQIHAAIFVPFSRVAELQQDPNLNVMLHTSTREDALLINHTVEPLNDVRARMDFSLRCAYAHGTRLIRTHLDSLGPQHRITWPVFAEMREAWQGRIALQAAALIPLEATEDRAWFDELVRLIVDCGGVLGGLTRMGPNLEAELDLLFRTAIDNDLDIDLHVDETADAEVLTLAAIAEAALRHKYQGQVVVGHCCSLARQDADTAARTIDKVAQAGLAVVSLPMCNMYLQDRNGGTPIWRGVTLFKELAAAGVATAV